MDLPKRTWQSVHLPPWLKKATQPTLPTTTTGGPTPAGVGMLVLGKYAPAFASKSLHWSVSPQTGMAKNIKYPYQHLHQQSLTLLMLVVGMRLLIRTAFQDGIITLRSMSLWVATVMAPFGRIPSQ